MVHKGFQLLKVNRKNILNRDYIQNSESQFGIGLVCQVTLNITFQNNWLLKYWSIDANLG